MSSPWDLLGMCHQRGFFLPWFTKSGSHCSLSQACLVLCFLPGFKCLLTSLSVFMTGSWEWLLGTPWYIHLNHEMQVASLFPLFHGSVTNSLHIKMSDEFESLTHSQEHLFIRISFLMLYVFYAH